MYPMDSVPDLSSANRHAPANECAVAWNECSEIRSYDNIRDATANFSMTVPFGQSLAREIRQAYFAGMIGHEPGGGGKEGDDLFLGQWEREKEGRRSGARMPFKFVRHSPPLSQPPHSQTRSWGLSWTR